MTAKVYGVADAKSNMVISGAVCQRAVALLRESNCALSLPTLTLIPACASVRGVAYFAAGPICRMFGHFLNNKFSVNKPEHIPFREERRASPAYRKRGQCQPHSGAQGPERSSP